MKTRFIALAVATTLGFGSVSAFAQDHHRDRGNNQNWQQRDNRVDQGRRNWADNNRYNAPRYYQPSYGRRDNGDVVGALVLGALAGAVIGQASNNNYNYAPGYVNPGYGTYYNPGYGTYQAPGTVTYYGSGNGYYGN
jgi:hypothetical protein